MFKNSGKKIMGFVKFVFALSVILAVLVLSALPMIILFIIFQDKLVKGMMAGAVKG